MAIGLANEVPLLLWKDMGRLLEINGEQAQRIEQLQAFIWHHGLDVPEPVDVLRSKRSSEASIDAPAPAQESEETEKNPSKRFRPSEPSLPQFSRLSAGTSWALKLDDTVPTGDSSTKPGRQSLSYQSPVVSKSSRASQSEPGPYVAVKHPSDVSSVRESEILGNASESQQSELDSSVHDLNREVRQGRGKTLPGTHNPVSAEVHPEAESFRADPTHSSISNERSQPDTSQNSLAESDGPTWDLTHSRNEHSSPLAERREASCGLDATDHGTEHGTLTNSRADRTSPSLSKRSEGSQELSPRLDHDASRELAAADAADAAGSSQPKDSPSATIVRPGPRGSAASERSRVSFMIPQDHASNRSVSPTLPPLAASWKPSSESSPLKRAPVSAPSNPGSTRSLPPSPPVLAKGPASAPASSMSSNVDNSGDSTAKLNDSVSSATLPSRRRSHIPRINLSQRLLSDRVSSASLYATAAEASVNSDSNSRVAQSEAPSRESSNILDSVSPPRDGPNDGSDGPKDAGEVQQPQRHRITRKLYNTEGDNTLPTVDPIRGDPADISVHSPRPSAMRI